MVLEPESQARARASPFLRSPRATFKSDKKASRCQREVLENHRFRETEEAKEYLCPESGAD